MKVPCSCGKWHELTQTDLAMVVDAFLSGDLQRVGHNKRITNLCILYAGTPDRVHKFEGRYHNNVISIDRKKKGPDNGETFSETVSG